MGLGVALAGTFMVTEGLKDIYGKPRPDLLARCEPDLANPSQYGIGGLGYQLPEATLIVDWRICQQTDAGKLRDGFASFPSGHASLAWAGMFYLTLFICAKFAISIPFLAPVSYRQTNGPELEDDTFPAGERASDASAPRSVSARNQAAAPPVYLLILAFLPLGAAFFIAGSRWVDYRHHGFDIIAGSLIGFFFAWFGFRWYHLPIRRGAGWAWSARSRDRALYVGVGVPSYVGDEGWESSKTARPLRRDLESGSAMEIVTGSEMSDLRRDNSVRESIKNGDGPMEKSRPR